MASNSCEKLMEGAKDFVDDTKENITSNTLNQESNISDTPKMENTHNEFKENQKKEEQTEMDENAVKKLKKKLKKQRQREKKKSERSDTNDDDVKQNRESTDDLKSNISTTPSVDEEVDDDKEIDETEEFDFINGEAAFLSAALKKGNKKLVNSKADKTHAKVTPIEDSGSTHEEHNATFNGYVDNPNGNAMFTFVKGKRTKLPNAQEISVALGLKAVEFIMRNQILPAIKYSSDAIQQDPSCIDHYVNRSFCYLRSKQYPLAKADAQHVIQNTQDIKTVMKAKYILAQAFCGLKNFGDAEKYLTDCLSTIPHNVYFQRELRQLRITQLTNLGFRERDVKRVLQNCSSTMEAIDILVQDSANAAKDSPRAKNSTFDEDEVYYSEED